MLCCRREELHGTEKILQWVIAALAIALCISFVKISALEREVDNVQRNAFSQLDQLRNEISDIYGNVDQQLEEQASILSGAEVSIGDFHEEDRTVDVTLTVVPKVIPEDAAVSVSLGSQTAELIRQGNGFSGTFPVDIFTQYSLPLLSIATQDETQTEYIRDTYLGELWYKFIPSVYYCDIDSGTVSAEGKYSIKGGFNLNFSAPTDTPGAQFEQFVLVTQINGREVEREDITADVLADPGYGSGVHYQPYEKDYDTKNGDELAIRLEATDSLGCVHKILALHWKRENGATAEAVSGSEVIYDAQGKLLYGDE